MTWILPRQLHTLASALDTEALSLDSNEQSQVCAQSLFVRSKPSPSAIWLRKWKRDSWTRHLSGRILRSSLGQRFATEWTSSLGATHASPSVQQASDLEVKTPGISGRISQEAFQFFNQESASLKTSRATLPVGCITFCATWEDWVTEQRGAYSARLNAVHLTNASGCSSWPSPVASEVRQGFQDRSRGMKGSQESLTTVVIKGWPTPNAADSLQGGTTQGNRKDPNLSIAVHGPAAPASSSTDGSRPGLWHTPTQAPEAPNINSRRAVREGRQPKGQQHSLLAQAQWQTATVSTGANRQKDGSMTDKLDRQVKQSWPTPASAGVTGGPTGLAGGSGNREKLASMLPDAEARAMGCGKLNPRWVETLMGLPVGWTMPSCASPVTIERMNSDSSVTVLSQQQQNEPSEA